MENTNDELKLALVGVMDELTTKQLELKTQLKSIEKEIEKIEFQMKEVLEKENQEIITVGYWSFGWDVKQRTAFDQKAFKEKHPDLYEDFKTTKEIRTFMFGHKEN